MHHERSHFPIDLVEELGNAVELVWVLGGDLAADTSLPRLLRKLGEVVDVSGLDVEQAAAAIARHHPDGIVSFVDDHLVMAAHLAQQLGLAFHSPEVAGMLVDKARQRVVLDAAGIAGPRSWPARASCPPEEREALLRAVVYPAVLKPVEGSGSRGIRLVEDAAGLASALDEGESANGYLVEEYLEDDPQCEPWLASYLSVESVIDGRQTQHVALTGRFPLAEPFRETGNVIPAVLDPHLRPPLLEMVDAAVEALGITSAVIHTEIKLTPDGPRLIEVNGRLGGRPPYVLRSVSDINLFEVACRVAAREHVELAEIPPCRGVGYWLMLQPPRRARTIGSISGVDAVARLAGVDSVHLKKHAGDRVDWRDGTASEVASIRGRATDHVALRRLVARIRDMVAISYEV
jgi:biotin carboxylase